VTRQHNQQFHCPNCQTFHSAETLFGRWIRRNSQLSSGLGFCVIDQDFWIHRFKTYRNRELQLLMLVEIKTNGAPLTEAQRDTLYVVNQFMRNRKATPTKELRHQPLGYVPVHSTINGRRISVRGYGMHVLTFSGLGPDDSDWIAWDQRQIDVEMLTRILCFDLDPDTLGELDLRKHHRTAETQVLPLFGETDR